MKNFTAILLTLVMVLCLMTGCTGGTVADETVNPTQETTMPTEAPTQPTTAPTEPTQAVGTADTSAAQLLAKIWAQYGTDQQFASYGGTVEHAVNDAPGDLDMTNTDEITNKYLLPVDQLGAVESGASLVHLMNNNIFTAAAFKLKDSAQVRTVAKALRDNIQKARWLCGQPDELLIAEADGHLLMAFAAKENMEIFQQNLNKAFADATILYDEAVTA